MPDTPNYPLQIFFDGSCSVCAREMEAYRRKERTGRLQFVDISAPGFDPAPYHITLEELMHEMHAIDRENHVFRGVEAFRAIWQAFPASTGDGLLGVLVKLPGVNLLARVGYWSFARVRKFLPHTPEAYRGGKCDLGKGPPPP